MPEGTAPLDVEPRPGPAPAILVVDDEPALLTLLRRMLEDHGYEVLSASTGRAALAAMDNQVFDLILSDLRLPDLDGMELLRRIKTYQPETPFILITGQGSVRSAVEAMREGAHDYLSKPLEPDELLIVIGKALEQRDLLREVRHLREATTERYHFDRIVGKSKPMMDLFAILRRVCASDATVLVQGESGTGKELIARALHENGPRSRGPFIAVNASGLHETLLESELFGHVRGAFTGAFRAAKGLFEEASGGTLFLDEIGDVSPGMQSKLLRALQEREIKPVGSTQVRKVDVRVITATNRDLQQAVQSGRFREDLYYRLAVISLEVPPLRRRPEDIPILCEHILREIRQRSNSAMHGFSARAMQALLSHPWPGNVRELENTVERACVVCDGPTLDLAHLPPGFQPQPLPPQEDPQGPRPLAELVGRTVRGIEQDEILRALHASGGNRSRAATLLGISRGSLYNKMRGLGIHEAPRR